LVLQDKNIMNDVFTPLRIKNAQISHLYPLKTAHYVGVLNG